MFCRRPFPESHGHEGRDVIPRRWTQPSLFTAAAPQPHGALAGLAIPAAARTSEPQLRSLKIPDGRAGCAVSVFQDAPTLFSPTCIAPRDALHPETGDPLTTPSGSL
ncbi:uncharacterized protein ACIBXB_014026 isoform 1-T4 [Morphnus guianensis]